MAARRRRHPPGFAGRLTWVMGSVSRLYAVPGRLDTALRAAVDSRPTPGLGLDLDAVHKAADRRPNSIVTSGGSRPKTLSPIPYLVAAAGAKARVAGGNLTTANAGALAMLAAQIRATDEYASRALG